MRKFKNQTEIHEWLSKQTYNFLKNMATARGLIWRQEHTMHNGMRPDAIGFCSLQMFWEQKLIGNSHNGVGRCDDYLFVFESKVSYSDYKNSFNGSGEWKENPYANFHFLVVPKDFSKTYDLSNLPDYWGILEPVVSALKIVKYPKFIEIDRLFFLEAAYTVLFKWGRTLWLIDLNSRSDKIEILDKYSRFLESEGYMENDWRAWQHYAIDEFLKTNK